MSNENRELSLEATIDEMADYELDAVSGGVWKNRMGVHQANLTADDPAALLTAILQRP
jgi:hypothetical protein